MNGSKYLRKTWINQADDGDNCFFHRLFLENFLDFIN